MSQKLFSTESHKLNLAGLGEGEILGFDSSEELIDGFSLSLPGGVSPKRCLDFVSLLTGDGLAFVFLELFRYLGATFLVTLGFAGSWFFGFTSMTVSSLF